MRYVRHEIKSTSSDFVFHRAGYIKYTVPLNLTKYLLSEDEYVPWAAIDNNMEVITSILPQSSVAYKYLKVCTTTSVCLRTPSHL